MGNSKGKFKYVPIVILAVIIIAGLVATVSICSRGKSTELRELEAKAIALCEEAGLEDVHAKVTGPTALSEYKCYTLTVTGNGAEKIGYPKLIELMNTVDDYEVSFNGSVLQSRFIVDGARFKYFSFCGYLFRDEEKVYPKESYVPKVNESNRNDYSWNRGNNRKTAQKKDSQSSGADPYNVKDYIDPEDFYEDYYDDFYDYEDAEDYYYENSD